MAALWAIGLALLSTIFSALGPILFKKGSTSFNLNPFRQIKNYHLLAGIGLYALGLIAFVPALAGGNLSVIYPIISVKYIWVSLLSVFLLGEHMTRMKWIGIFLIIIGISLIGLA
jgi:uncharacterized membrane protein